MGLASGGCRVTTNQKWKIRKRQGMWMVRRPNGTHLGSFFTWAEAFAQTVARLSRPGPAATGGCFDRRSTWDHDDQVWGNAFGFVGPVRASGEESVR